MLAAVALAALLLAAGPALADAPCVPGTTGPGGCQPKPRPKPPVAAPAAPAPVASAPQPILLPPILTPAQEEYAARMAQEWWRQQQSADGAARIDQAQRLIEARRRLRGEPVRTVPEPSSLWLVVAGLAAALWSKRR